METNLTINKSLLEQAHHIGGLDTENETINVALGEFIEKRAIEDIVASFNTVEFDACYNYKKLRNKR
jgi:hypothetical protein